MKEYSQEDVDCMLRPPYVSIHDYPANIEEKIKWNEFLWAIEDGDFALGDSFWLNGIEFTVTKKED